MSAKFRFLRVNPFRGLLIDEHTWADAHDYHRNQMRFHLLTLHGSGIAQGLEVGEMQPPDTRVLVQAGVAIDPEGRLLLLGDKQTVEVVRNGEAGTFFITLEYSEEVTQTQNITEGGTPQVARVLEACKIVVNKEATYTGVELARIVLETGSKQIRNAANRLQPRPNEINPAGRKAVAGGQGATGEGTNNRLALTMGTIRYGPSSSNEWKRHSEGVRRLATDTGLNTNLEVNLLEGINLMDKTTLDNCRVLYLTGRAAFNLGREEEQALQNFLERGGVLWCEPCRSGLAAGAPDEFSRRCMEMAQRLNRQPIQPRTGHPLLTSRYLFAAAPPALEPAGVVVEAKRMVLATGDYGCLWEGHGQERAEPPPREVLRAAQEFGGNALFLAMN